MNILKVLFGKPATHLLQNLFKKVEHLSHSAREMYSQSESLKKLIASEKTSIQSSSSASVEISSMVGTTAEAAKRLNETAAHSDSAVETSVQSLRELSQSVNEVRELSETLKHSVTNGLNEIAAVATTLAEIKEKAKMINDIVFQTKLLSFNASVEAARAGENGKGFAVVAEEMGNLAKASGSAAQQIEAILDKSLKLTQEQVSRVSQDLAQITNKTVESISRVSLKSSEIEVNFDKISQFSKSTKESAAEISNATAEQNIGVKQISESLSQLDHSSHELNDLAEKGYKASADLAAKVEEIQNHLMSIAPQFGFEIKKEEKPFDFGAAITAHIDWKMKLTKYLQNPDGSLDPNKVCLDNACALGKWVYGDGAKYSKISPQKFEHLRASHAEFHGLASKIVSLIHEGKKTEASRVLSPEGAYQRVSDRTVGLIRELQNEVQNISQKAA